MYNRKDVQQCPAIDYAIPRSTPTRFTTLLFRTQSTSPPLDDTTRVWSSYYSIRYLEGYSTVLVAGRDKRGCRREFTLILTGPPKFANLNVYRSVLDLNRPLQSSNDNHDLFPSSSLP